MDECDQSRFQALIKAKLSELDQQDALGHASQNTVELDQQAIGRLSRQDALLNQSMAKATQARRDANRRALKAALVRLAEDEFGFCDDCGDEIAQKRLELDPTAMRCISCANG